MKNGESMAFFLMHQQCWFCDSQIGAVDRWRALKASSAACWEIISYVQCFLGEGFPGKGLFLFIYYFLVFFVALLLVLRWGGGASICTEYAFWRTLYNVYNGKLTFPPMCGEILYVETYLYIVWPLYIYTYKWLWSLWPFFFLCSSAGIANCIVLELEFRYVQLQYLWNENYKILMTESAILSCSLFFLHFKWDEDNLVIRI